jgi:hypothetical protein
MRHPQRPTGQAAFMSKEIALEIWKWLPPDFFHFRQIGWKWLPEASWK